MVETTHLYYIYQLNTYVISCGIILAFIKAVNGAGESDPSNNVTIPSLPDIAPVTASLRHQVWKSGGEVMVSVLFEVSYIHIVVDCYVQITIFTASYRFCTEYPTCLY